MQPKRIKMSDKHNMSGIVLMLYTGAAYKWDWGGGVSTVVKPGDYTNFNSHMDWEWLQKNPEMWTEVADQ